MSQEKNILLRIVSLSFIFPVYAAHPATKSHHIIVTHQRMRLISCHHRTHVLKGSITPPILANRQQCKESIIEVKVSFSSFCAPNINKVKSDVNLMYAMQ
jgi:hypothetical protein